MAARLTKKQFDRRNEIVTKLNDEASKVSAAIDELNAAIEEHNTSINIAIEAYNEILAEAREFAEEVVAEANDIIEAKSEKWADSETGQSVANWRDEWDALSFDDAEIELPEEVHLDFEAADELENAPEEAVE